MNMSLFLRPLILLTIFAAAGVTDAVFHKIYNSLILTGFLLILSVHIAEPPGIDPYSLCYSLFFLLIIFVLFSFGMLGGGDVKLYLLTVFAYPDNKGWRILALSVISAALVLIFSALKNRLAPGKPQIDASGRNSLKISPRGLPMAVFIFAASCPVLLTL